MKKLFAVIGISVMSFCAFLGGTKKDSVAPMYAETESSQVVSSSESPVSSNENESEEPIDIDKETKDISNTAKDVIEVIKTIFNQPIVIGGVSITLGSLILFIFGKVFVKLLENKSTKYDKKIKDVLEKVGINEETLKVLLENVDLLNNVIKEIIENTKNIQVKEKLQALYNENKDKAKNSSQVLNEQAKQIVEKAKENIEKSTQDTIKELLEK